MEQNQQIESDKIEIDLIELGQTLLRKWWLILVVALLSMAATIGITKFWITPTYQSQAMLYVLTNTTSVTSVTDLQIGTAITDDFLIIATSKPTVDRAIEIIKDEEDIKFTRSEILGMISVKNEEDTRILTIEAISTDSADSCRVANAMARATAERMAEITKKDPPTVVEDAEVSKSPVGPNVRRNAILGFVGGAALVCIILLVQLLRNDNIKTEGDVEKYLGEVTLASIPYVKGLNEKGAEQKNIKGVLGGKKQPK